MAGSPRANAHSSLHSDHRVIAESSPHEVDETDVRCFDIGIRINNAVPERTRRFVSSDVSESESSQSGSRPRIPASQVITELRPHPEDKDGKEMAYIFVDIQKPLR